MTLRRVLALRAEATIPSEVGTWPEQHQCALLFSIGKIFAELECGHSKRLYQGHYGQTETCFECANHEMMGKQINEDAKASQQQGNASDATGKDASASRADSAAAQDTDVEKA